jgi:hypothetical protein
VLLTGVLWWPFSGEGGVALIWIISRESMRPSCLLRKSQSFEEVLTRAVLRLGSPLKMNRVGMKGAIWGALFPWAILSFSDS